jgi:hypothetical protein
MTDTFGTAARQIPPDPIIMDIKMVIALDYPEIHTGDRSLECVFPAVQFKVNESLLRHLYSLFNIASGLKLNAKIGRGCLAIWPG